MKLTNVEIHREIDFVNTRLRPATYVVVPDMANLLISQGVKPEQITVIHEPYGPWAPIKPHESRRRILEGLD